MIKVKAKVKEKGPGIGKLVERLGGLGHLSLGVQGKEAEEKHSSSELAVGQVAAIWELGLSPTGPRRSWLSSWIDANQARMVADAREVFQDIIAGKLSRKRGFEKLGMKWATEIRDNVAAGRVTPPLRPSTIKLKGHAIPLVDTWDLHNAIGYKVYLPQWKNVPGGSASGAARLAMAKTLPPTGEVKNSPQPADRGGGRRMFGPKEPRGLRPKLGPKRPPRALHPRQEKYGVKFRKKYVGLDQAAYSALRQRKGKIPGFKKSSRGREVLMSARRVRKSAWALKWLKRLAKAMLRQSGSTDYRNRGYKGSSKYGRTGRSGR